MGFASLIFCAREATAGRFCLLDGTCFGGLTQGIEALLSVGWGVEYRVESLTQRE